MMLARIRRIPKAPNGSLLTIDSVAPSIGRTLNSMQSAWPIRRFLMRPRLSIASFALPQGVSGGSWYPTQTSAA